MIYIPSSHPEKTSRIKENTGQLSDDPISISTVHPGLELQYLCVHIEICLHARLERSVFLNLNLKTLFPLLDIKKKNLQTSLSAARIAGI